MMPPTGMVQALTPRLWDGTYLPRSARMGVVPIETDPIRRRVHPEILPPTRSIRKPGRKGNP